MEEAKSELLHINSYEPKTQEQLEKDLSEVVRNFLHVDIEQNRVIIVYEVRKRGE